MGDIRVETITGSVSNDVRRELVEVNANAYLAAPCERTHSEADAGVPMR